MVCLFRGSLYGHFKRCFGFRVFCRVLMGLFRGS